MTPESGLDEDEVQEAVALIRRAAPGIYTLPKLYGPLWDGKASPTAFGTRFKASVDAGQLAGISFRGKSSANHARYEVHAC